MLKGMSVFLFILFLFLPLWSLLMHYYLEILLIVLEQGSQARGPPDAFVRPASISKFDNILSFEQILLIFRAFLVVCGPRKRFLL